MGQHNTTWQTIREYDAAHLQTRYPHPERILIAIRLAKDIDTCCALLQGEPVDPSRVHHNELGRMARRRLVRLDLTALDLL